MLRISKMPVYVWLALVVLCIVAGLWIWQVRKQARHAKAEKLYAAGRDAYAALMVAVAGFKEAGYASDHDALIAKKIAYILTGGALAEPQWIDQQVFLDLERQAFLELIMETKTQERIMYMLQNNKPLRN